MHTYSILIHKFSLQQLKNPKNIQAAYLENPPLLLYLPRITISHEKKLTPIGKSSKYTPFISSRQPIRRGIRRSQHNTGLSRSARRPDIRPRAPRLSHSIYNSASGGSAASALISRALLRVFPHPRHRLKLFPAAIYRAYDSNFGRDLPLPDSAIGPAVEPIQKIATPPKKRARRGKGGWPGSRPGLVKI